MPLRRVAPPAGAMRSRPFEGASPGWLYVQNGVYVGAGVRSREGSLVYVDAADLVGQAIGDQRVRALIPYRDPRGYALLFVYRDWPGLNPRVRAYSGVHLLATVGGNLVSGNVGFPTWTNLNDNILIARRGDPLRVLGVDDGAEPFMEDVVARDRDQDPLEVDFDDNGPYARTVPRGHIVHAWQQRVWLSDGSDVVRWSNGLGDYEGWPAGNFRIVADGAAEGIRAISSLGDRLALFRYRSIVIGWGDPANGGPAFSTERARGSTFGCIAPRSVVEIGGQLWFLSQTGEVCVFDGARAESVTRPLQDFLRPQVPLSLDPVRFRRGEASSLPDVVAVWYQPWDSYVMFMEGETAGVWDLGLAVNVRSGQASVLTGPDVQAMCVKAGDEDMLLTADRFGVVYVQDRGPHYRTTTETFDTPSSSLVHTHPTADVPFLAVPHPVPVQASDRTKTPRVAMLLEHLDARAPTVRPVEDTLTLKGTYRIEQDRPAVVAVDGASLYAGYMAEQATERPEDFIIGTTPVQPDGFLDAGVGLPGTSGYNSTVIVRNDVAADGEAAAENPQAVGLVLVDLEQDGA